MKFHWIFLVSLCAGLCRGAENATLEGTIEKVAPGLGSVLEQIPGVKGAKPDAPAEEAKGEGKSAASKRKPSAVEAGEDGAEWDVARADRWLDGLTLDCPAPATGAADALQGDLAEEPPVRGCVLDLAGVFSAEEAQALVEEITACTESNGAQLVVVCVPTLHGIPVEDAASRLFNRWGIGEKGKDNGVLFLTSLGDHAMRIEVGYGFEGALTDGVCGRIRDRAIFPHFREEEYAEGIREGTRALLKVMAGEEFAGGGGGGNGWTALLIVVGGMALLIWLACKFGGGGTGTGTGGPSGFAGGVGGGRPVGGGSFRSSRGGFRGGGGRSGGGGASGHW